jgi:hypothetical protein
MDPAHKTKTALLRYTTAIDCGECDGTPDRIARLSRQVHHAADMLLTGLREKADLRALAGVERSEGEIVISIHIGHRNEP